MLQYITEKVTISIFVAYFLTMSYHESSHVCSMKLFWVKNVVPEMVGVSWAAQDHSH